MKKTVAGLFTSLDGGVESPEAVGLGLVGQRCPSTRSSRTP